MTRVLRAIVASFAAALGLLLVLPAVAIALPFWIVSALYGAFHALLARPVVSWKELIEFEPVVGWKPKAGLQVRAMADEAFRLTTDSAGWRGPGTVAESEIVVFGDSFAFGYGVDDSVMYAIIDPELRVKAVGVNGYNLVQSYLWMERYAEQLSGKIVVWLIYHGNDLYENLCPNLDHYRMPFVRRRGEREWEIVTDHVSPEPWPYPGERRYLEKLAEICTGGALSDRAFGACEFLIGKAQELCREAAAELVVVSAPDLTQIESGAIERLRNLSPEPERFDPDLPDRRLREICHERDMRFVTLKQHVRPRDFKVRDVHWRPSGHRSFGRVLKAIRDDRQWPEPVGGPAASPWPRAVAARSGTAGLTNREATSGLS